MWTNQLSFADVFFFTLIFWTDETKRALQENISFRSFLGVFSFLFYNRASLSRIWNHHWIQKVYSSLFNRIEFFKWITTKIEKSELLVEQTIYAAGWFIVVFYWSMAALTAVTNLVKVEGKTLNNLESMNIVLWCSTSFLSVLSYFNCHRTIAARSLFNGIAKFTKASSGCTCHSYSPSFPLESYEKRKQIARIRLWKENN